MPKRSVVDLTVQAQEKQDNHASRVWRAPGGWIYIREVEYHAILET